jgi:hypothetical protein
VINLDVTYDVKAMSLLELHGLRIKIADQCASGEVTVEDYMRADIEITKLIVEKGGAL